MRANLRTSSRLLHHQRSNRQPFSLLNPFQRRLLLTTTTTTMPPTIEDDKTAAAAVVEALKKNTPIVISGPSGAGKSTLLTKILAESPDKFGFSISHTTRSPRPGEENGKQYHFVTRDEFLALQQRGGFIEHAQFGGNLYGTSVAAVEQIAEQGKVCVLDIEMEGVKQVASPDSKLPVRPRFLFVAPPSLEVLEARLRGRGTENEESLRKRLDQARVELAFAESGGVHDEVIVNDDLAVSLERFRAFLTRGNS